jgi:hypothetical protein
MQPFAQLTKVVAFLRSENPVEDISENQVVQHPHNTSRAIPERLPAVKIKESSVLEPPRAACSYRRRLSIAVAMALCSYGYGPQ